MMRIVLIGLLLAGCAPSYGPIVEPPQPPPAPPPPPPPAWDGKCGIRDFIMREFVGRPYSPEIGAELLRRAQAASLRLIRPGDAVTMDFREDRLNVELDANGAVAAYRCG